MSGAEEAKPGHAESHGARVVLLLLAALGAYSVLPFLGVGTYQSANGQRFFSLWYMVGFLLIAFFLMHEFITPLPPADNG
jgi:hypothetical protein